MDTQHFLTTTEPFGLKIAAFVADCLQNGAILGYCHRDYCGMAMKAEGQQFLYGELYDGEDFHVPGIFETREILIIWLAAQSTESLARLDDAEFYRNNQVITRNRLLDFIGLPDDVTL